jgi:hypothetical protein
MEVTAHFIFSLQVSRRSEVLARGTKIDLCKKEDFVVGINKFTPLRHTRGHTPEEQLSASHKLPFSRKIRARRSQMYLASNLNVLNSIVWLRA